MVDAGPLAARLLLVVAGAAYVGVGVRVANRRGGPAAEPFVAMALLAGLAAGWLALPPLLGVETNPSLRTLAPLYLLPVGLAAFALEYTGHLRIRSDRHLLLLAVPPAWGVAYNYAVWGVEAGGGLFAVLEVGGILAILALGYAAAMAFGALGLFAWTAYRYDYVDTRSTGLVAVGGVGPWVAVLVGFRLSGFVDSGVVPPVVLPAVYGVGFGVGALCLAGAVRTGRAFDRVPASGNLGPETVLAAMDDPVLVLDGDERVVRQNPATRETLSTDDADVGATLEDLLGVDLDGLRSTPSVELTVDGESREFEHTVSSIADQHGRAVGYSVVLHDVTERESRKHRIRELDRTRRRLERKNERLDEFASVVSHDLRNPLNVAKGSLDLARNGGSEADLDRVEEGLERMEDIIEDVLVLARSGGEIEEPEPVDLASTAEEAWTNVRTGGSDLEFEGGLPTVEGDRDRLLQLFENLFRNAVEHNDDRVTVRVGPLDGTRGIFVADDGAGIPESEREEVFEHGYTTSRDGTGFGLSIVADVVDAHGWDVGVREGSGGGARFEIRTG